MPISKRLVQKMTTEELLTEFKSLARQRAPIDSRRAELAAEMKSRTNEKEMDIKIKHFFPTTEDRKHALRLLKQELGE